MPNQHTKKAAQKSARAAKRSARKMPSREEIMQTKGHKDDAKKVKYELIPAGPLHHLACLYTFGSVKYADENWRKGIGFKRMFGALMRHAWACMRGEWIDAETGVPHLICAAFCCFTMVELQEQHNRKDLDDRFIPPKGIDTSPYEEAVAEMKKKKGK